MTNRTSDEFEGNRNLKTLEFHKPSNRRKLSVVSNWGWKRQNQLMTGPFHCLAVGIFQHLLGSTLS